MESGSTSKDLGVAAANAICGNLMDMKKLGKHDHRPEFFNGIFSLLCLEDILPHFNVILMIHVIMFLSNFQCLSFYIWMRLGIGSFSYYNGIFW